MPTANMKRSRSTGSATRSFGAVTGLLDKRRLLPIPGRGRDNRRHGTETVHGWEQRYSREAKLGFRSIPMMSPQVVVDRSVGGLRFHAPARALALAHVAASSSVRCHPEAYSRGISGSRIARQTEIPPEYRSG